MDQQTLDGEPPVAGPSDRGDGGRSRAAMRARARQVGVDIGPVLLYTVVYALTKNITLAAVASTAAGAIVVVVRLVQRRAPWRSLAALALVVAGGYLAGRSGTASAYFLPQILLGIAGVVVILLLILVKLPPAGLLMNVFTGERLEWRRCPVRLRAYSLSSLVLVAMPLLGLAANIPLYVTHNVIGLGIVDMVNPFVNALVVLVAWRVYRRVVGDHTCSPESHGEAR